MGSPSTSGWNDGAGKTLDGEIKVNFGGLQAGSDQINASAKKIDSTLEDLKGDLAPLRAKWTGDAATNYDMHQKQWDDAAKDLQSVLASIATALSVANQDYMDGERNNANRWI